MGRILQPGPPPEELHESPEEVTRFRAAAEEIEDGKRQALGEPGPSWKDRWYYSASKWYIVLLFLIVDAWALGSLFVAWYIAVPVLVALVYGEFVLYEYLYRRPHPERRHRGISIRRSWYRPFGVGRWTPEGAAIRTGARSADEVIESADEGPSAEEFF